jgi:ribosomal protein S18 acetylase RimI-like enzyme
MPPDPETVTTCELSNLQEAYELWAECDTRVDGLQSPREAGWRRYFSQHPERFISAYSKDGRLVGVCVLFDDGRKAGVYRLAVAKQWRRRGVARQLLQQAEEVSRNAGLRGIYALIETSSPESRNLFTDEGYSEIKSVRYFTKSI